jgi:Flp pilus assembly protein CpaB
VITRLRRLQAKSAHATAPPNGDGRVLLGPRAADTAARPPLRSQRLLQPIPLAGFALMLIGLLVVLAAAAAAAHRTAVIVAARNLPAGTVVQLRDLRSSRIGADANVLAALVSARQEQIAVGHRLALPLEAGEPLPRAAIAASSASPAAFTLAVPAAHALGGQLRAGDHISVIATFTGTTGNARTEALARDLVVLTVGAPPSIGDPNQSTIPVTVALPDTRLAARLALANSTAKIDLLRDSSRSGATAIPTATTPGGTSP